MRLPYVSDPPQNLTPAEEEVVQRVRARRGPHGLIPLDLTLLHSPPVTDGWNALLGAIRTKTSLAADVREIAICRVALINEAWFEWNAHVPILLGEGGLTEAGLEVVRRQDVVKGKGALNDKQWLVLKYADAMTKSVKVDDRLFKELKGVGFNEKEIVELTATIAGYNMVSRFLVALDVGEMNGKGPSR